MSSDTMLERSAPVLAPAPSAGAGQRIDPRGAGGACDQAGIRCGDSGAGRGAEGDRRRSGGAWNHLETQLAAIAKRMTEPVGGDDV